MKTKEYISKEILRLKAQLESNRFDWSAKQIKEIENQIARLTKHEGNISDVD